MMSYWESEGAKTSYGLRYLFTLMVFGVNMTPTIYRVIVKNLYIFNNTNNISFFFVYFSSIH